MPCAALAGKDVDVRGPEWSYDGAKVIFAARPGAASGLDLWELDVAGGTCKQLTSDAGRLVNGVRLHNFDPVYAPDGSVVFASTRAGTVTLKRFLPNSDLFRVTAPALDFGNPQQMTFLLNSELSPAFMQDGRVTMTTEKATAEFYQLSGRRINWDLTDYHPLLAQRATSTDTFSPDVHPSVGYQQATEIREGLDRNFILILSDAPADGAVNHGGGGGALYNIGTVGGNGQLTLINSTLSGNTADSGGAIFNIGIGFGGVGTLTVSNSTFSGNHGANGGALYALGAQLVDVFDTQFSGNSATGNGGNPGNGGNGGAIGIDGDARNVNLCRVIVSNNTSNAFGAGFFTTSYNTSSFTRIQDSTFLGNRSVATDKLVGGAYLQGTTFSIRGSTFQNNMAAGYAGIALFDENVNRASWVRG